MTSALSAEPPSGASFAPGAAALGDTQPPAVRARGLTKRFPIARPWAAILRNPGAREYVTSVRDVSFDVAPGEFFGLLGPNGAGKTTLFKLLAAAVLPDEGSAEVAGFDVVRSPKQVRRSLTAALTFDRTIIGRLSSRENLRITASLYRLHGAEATRRIEEVLEAVALADVGERRVETFSSGMRQRLSIARALVGRPKILLLDEPTRSLDPVSAKAFRDFLRTEISGRQGCTVMLATHQSEEAFELCDRVMMLNHGVVAALGRTADLVNEFRDAVFSVWTTEPNHPAFAAIAERGLASAPQHVGERAEGWTRVDLSIEGGMAASAPVVRALTEAGVPIARFEQTPLSLGDLIERVVARTSSRPR